MEFECERCLYRYMYNEYEDEICLKRHNGPACIHDPILEDKFKQRELTNGNTD